MAIGGIDTQRWKPEHSRVDSHSTRLSGTFYTKCSVNQSVSVSEPEHSVFVYVCANFGFSSSLHTLLSAEAQPLIHIINSLSACHWNFATIFNIHGSTSVVCQNTSQLIHSFNVFQCHFIHGHIMYYVVIGPKHKGCFSSASWLFSGMTCTSLVSALHQMHQSAD